MQCLPRPDLGPLTRLLWEQLQVVRRAGGIGATTALPPPGGLPLLQGSEARFLFCGPRPHSLLQMHPGPSPGELCVASALVLRPI